MDRGEEVHFDRAVPRLARLVLEGRRRWAAGIAEEHVEAAQLLGDALHQLLGLVGHAHVGDEWRDSRSRFARQILGDAGRRVLVAPVDGEARPLLR
jgi:hypothetical protein